MQHFSLDDYVIDVLMPDLVGHNRRPATFIGTVKIHRSGVDPASAPAQTARPGGPCDKYRPGSTDLASLETLSKRRVPLMWNLYADTTAKSL